MFAVCCPSTLISARHVLGQAADKASSRRVSLLLHPLSPLVSSSSAPRSSLPSLTQLHHPLLIALQLSTCSPAPWLRSCVPVSGAKSVGRRFLRCRLTASWVRTEGFSAPTYTSHLCAPLGLILPHLHSPRIPPTAFHAVRPHRRVVRVSDSPRLPSPYRSMRHG